MVVRSGQAALEYMVMISLALLIASPIIVEAQGMLFQLQQTNDAARLSNALDTMKRAVSIVDSQGDPARVTFSVTIPEGIVDSNVTGSTLVYTLKQSGSNGTYIRSTDSDLNGELPVEPGQYRMQAEAGEGHVNVSTT